MQAVQSSNSVLSRFSFDQRIEGWAELFEGAGACRDQVETALYQELAATQQPQLEVARQVRTTSSTMPGEGKRIVAKLDRSPASVIVGISSFGDDLYVSWDLYTRRDLNIAVILGILILALIMEVFTGAGTYSVGGYFSLDLGYFFRAPLLFIVSAVSHLFQLGLIVALAGYVTQGTASAFYFTRLSPSLSHTTTAMTKLVQRELLKALTAVGVAVDGTHGKEQLRLIDTERFW